MRRPRQNALHDAPARARTLTLQTAQRARQARRELLVLVPLVALTIVAYVERERLFGLDTPVRVAAALLLLALGYALARDIGRFIAPALFRRMDPATAGTAGFLTRLAIALEEVDRDEVVVRVAATPSLDSDGPKLADDVLAALEPITRDVPEPAESDRDDTSLSGDEDAVTRGEAPDGDVAADGGRPADRGLRPRLGGVSQGYGA